MANHVVYGTVIFVLKYSDNSYIKLKINNLTYGVYNLTYSEWDATNKVWLDDVTRSVDSSSSSNTDFTYYNFIDDEKVTSEPAKDEWDLKFTKYTTPIQAGPQIVPYTVTGVLQSDLIKVAKTETGNPAK
ncbi:hypothetical protein [Chishuiella sp.]|uniref:hypothetical protein n=1 Tax=Chishuiella sp. TaxID=1969467 RepID=UPI0028AFFCB5|nr:hypothetical protein [Chishuiella sp.]